MQFTPSNVKYVSHASCVLTRALKMGLITAVEKEYLVFLCTEKKCSQHFLCSNPVCACVECWPGISRKVNAAICDLVVCQMQGHGPTRLPSPRSRSLSLLWMQKKKKKRRITTFLLSSPPFITSFSPKEAAAGPTNDPDPDPESVCLAGCLSCLFLHNTK